MTRRAWRAPLLATAILSLFWAVWLGLLRIGWALPLPEPEQLILHGPLMIGGFLGTLIGLERAVGVGGRWAYTAPVFTAAGSIGLVLGAPSPIAPSLITLGSVVVVSVFVVVLRHHRTMYVATMLIGAVAWVVGNALWTAGFSIYRIVFWWVAFIVCTIGGERLELNRLLRPRAFVRASFAATIAIIIAGIPVPVATV